MAENTKKPDDKNLAKQTSQTPDKTTEQTAKTCKIKSKHCCKIAVAGVVILILLGLLAVGYVSWMLNQKQTLRLQQSQQQTDAALAAMQTSLHQQQQALANSQQRMQQ